MIKYCLKNLDKNRDTLKAVITGFVADGSYNEWNYLDVVKLVVKICCAEYDYDHITEIDNGDYQGTLLYVIPHKGYQPGPEDYLMTYVYYGSCSGCDTLQGLQYSADNGTAISDLLSLCKDLMCHMIKPYNEYSICYDPEYDNVEF